MLLTYYRNGILLSFIFILINCNSETSVQNNFSEKSVIFPLSVGNEWIYKQTRYNSNGLSLDSLNFRSSIYGDTLLGYERWYKYTEGYLANRKDGLWFLFSVEVDSMNLDIQTILNSAILQWAYPSEKGITYSYINNISTITVLSIDTLITVPAGSFKCYEYELGNNIYYLAPDIGIVRIDYYIRPDSVYFLGARNELLLYHINNFSSY